MATIPMQIAVSRPRLSLICDTLAPQVSTGVYTAASFHALMGMAAGGLLLILTLLFRAESISFVAPDRYFGILTSMIPLAIVGAYCHWARLDRLRNACAMIAWAFPLAVLLPLASYAAARAGMPLEDGLFTGIDRAMGIDVGLIVQFTHAHAVIDAAMRRIYEMLSPLLFFAATIPAICGRRLVAQRFLISVLVAVVIGSIVFMLLPAAGPWEGYGFTPSAIQPGVSAELRMMRAAGPVVIDPGASSGLIAFPSFHVCLAVLAAFALAGFRWLRFPAAALALLICASTVMTGWHYGVDVIGGVVVAAASILAARRVVRIR